MTPPNDRLTSLDSPDDRGAAVWKAGRQLRSSLLALDGHEQHLGANIFRLSTARSGPSPIDTLLLRQSLKAAEETCRQGAEALEQVLRNTPADILQSEDRFAAALRENVPELGEEAMRPALTMATRYGGFEAWTDLLAKHLAVREKAFRASHDAVPQPGRAAAEGAVDEAVREMQREYDRLPALPSEVARFFDDPPTSADTFRDNLKAAVQDGIEAREAGQPAFLAGGRTNALLVEAGAWHPDDAARAGKFGTQRRPLASIICLVPTGPSLAFCVLVILIAASSHNVE